jgi:hypothetical protein
MENTKKCAHPSCVCQVGTDMEYCCTFCSGQADTPDIVCSCSHTACAETLDTTLPSREVSESVYVVGAVEVTPSHQH